MPRFFYVATNTTPVAAFSMSATADRKELVGRLVIRVECRFERVERGRRYLNELQEVALFLRLPEVLWRAAHA